MSECEKFIAKSAPNKSGGGGCGVAYPFCKAHDHIIFILQVNFFFFWIVNKTFIKKEQGQATKEGMKALLQEQDFLPKKKKKTRGG